MKRITLFLIVSLLSAFMIACQQNEEALRAEQEEYASKINTKIDQIDMEINELQSEVPSETEGDSLGMAEEGMQTEEGMQEEGAEFEAPGTAMNHEVERRITKLEEEKRELNDQFQKIWQTSEEEWETLKTEIDNQLAAVQEYLDEEMAVSLK